MQKHGSTHMQFIKEVRILPVEQFVDQYGTDLLYLNRQKQFSFFMNLHFFYMHGSFHIFIAVMTTEPSEDIAKGRSTT